MSSCASQCSEAAETGTLPFRHLGSSLASRRQPPIDSDPGAVASLPKAERRAAQWLRERGITPTPRAVQAAIDQRAAQSERAKVRRKRWTQLRPIIAAIVHNDGPRAAAYVAEVVARDGTGPSWRRVGEFMHWPADSYHVIIPRLAERKWLTYIDDQVGSLRPGPKFAAYARRRQARP